MGTDECGCDKRKAFLNGILPGLGDAVGYVADPVYNFYQNNLGGKPMPSILKPDMKSLVWLALGAFVAPMVIAKLKR